MESKSYISLYDLQLRIGNAIRVSRDTQYVWVMAELSDVRVAGGHCYMELIEKDAAGTTRAKMRAMIWSSTLAKLRAKFIAATGRDIASGMKVLVMGSASHHNVYGLSFTISDIDPSFTLGDMERLRREIIDRLTREGIAGYNRSLEPPVTPQAIAVISAAGAAGYGDFINQIESNPDRFAIYPKLFSAVMQGDRTASTVMDALDLVEATIDLWDCVVIIRGGGATTDLNGFDNYELARRVATFPLPVVVGIGHERDRTVLDELACVRCKTPTAVAAWIIDSLRVAYSSAVELVRRVAKYGADALQGEHIRYTHLCQSIPALARNGVMKGKLQLRDLASGLEKNAHQRIASANLNLTSISGRVEKAANMRLADAKNQLLMLGSRISTAAPLPIERGKLRLQRLEDLLRVLNPENTLRRGYSITRVDGHAVTSADQVPDGAEIETRLLQGSIISKKIK